jgi:integrase
LRRRHRPDTASPGSGAYARRYHDQHHLNEYGQQRAAGRRLDRYGAGWIVRKAARRAGIAKTVTPHTLRHAFITAALDAGVPLRDVQEAASHADPRTTMRHDRARGKRRLIRATGLPVDEDWCRVRLPLPGR